MQELGDIWPFKSDCDCFVPQTEHLTEEQRAFVAEVEAWVEFGRDKPKGPLWDQMVCHIADRDVKLAFRKGPDLEAMRHPRVILGLLSVCKHPQVDLLVVLSQSLAKYLSEPKYVLECVSFIATRCGGFIAQVSSSQSARGGA
jgi:hypothetical protein